MKTVQYNHLTYNKDIHDELVCRLGGINLIKDKVKNNDLLFGELHYYKTILAVYELFYG